MTKNLRKEIYRTQNEISNIFPEKSTVEHDIFEEIDYIKVLADALLKVDLKSEKAQKLLINAKNTLELPNLLELQSANDKDAKIGYKSEDKAYSTSDILKFGNDKKINIVYFKAQGKCG